MTRPQFAIILLGIVLLYTALMQIQATQIEYEYNRASERADEAIARSRAAFEAFHSN